MFNSRRILSRMEFLLKENKNKIKKIKAIELEKP
jgi:hypothetical protein